jgi:uncharacterized membrane protein
MNNIVNWIVGAIIAVILASTYILVMDLIQEGHLVSEILGVVGLIVLIVALVLGFQSPQKVQSG